jgi:hypothetical protein
VYPWEEALSVVVILELELGSMNLGSTPTKVVTNARVEVVSSVERI